MRLSTNGLDGSAFWIRRTAPEFVSRVCPFFGHSLNHRGIAGRACLYGSFGKMIRGRMIFDRTVLIGCVDERLKINSTKYKEKLAEAISLIARATGWYAISVLRE